MSEIHITDVQAYLRCRRMWDWQSQLRRGLQPAHLQEPLFLGQGIHVALDAYYSNPPKDRTFDVLESTFTEWVEHRKSLMEEQSGPLWSSDKEMITEIKTLGLSMLRHYQLWSVVHDTRWNFLSTEETFDLPLPFCDDDSIRFAGRFDGVVEEKDTGDLYLLEFKTTKRMANMRHQYRSMQGTAYVWAAQQVYGLNLKGILYRALLKKQPSDPRPLKRGGFSQAKNQSTSFEWMVFKLGEIADTHGIDPKEYYREHEDFLRYLHQEGNSFFDELALVKQQSQLDSIMRAVSHLGQEMVNPNTPVFPQPGFHCSWCSFEDPCKLKMHGGDYEGLLEASYASRRYWEEYNKEEDNK